MSKNNSTEIVYTPRDGATLRAELDALTAVYKFVLAKQRAAHPAALNEAKKGSEDGRPAQGILPK